MDKIESKSNAKNDSKISVIEEALLKNVIGGAGGAGEISSRLTNPRVECTGK